MRGTHVDATWQSHADSRKRLHGAEVARVHIYIFYIIHMVIVHIGIPHSEFANPLNRHTF